MGQSGPKGSTGPTGPTGPTGTIKVDNPTVVAEKLADTSGFVSQMIIGLGQSPELAEKVGQNMASIESMKDNLLTGLNDNNAFLTKVAENLITNYPGQLKGPPGPPGSIGSEASINQYIKPYTMWCSGGSCVTPTNSNLYITGGNIGIGTTTPSSRLHVNGNLSASSISTRGLDLTQQNVVANSTFIKGYGQNTNTSDYKLIDLGHGDTSFFVVNGNGNVGIGGFPVFKKKADCSAQPNLGELQNDGMTFGAADGKIYFFYKFNNQVYGIGLTGAPIQSSGCVGIKIL